MAQRLQRDALSSRTGSCTWSPQSQLLPAPHPRRASAAAQGTRPGFNRNQQHVEKPSSWSGVVGADSGSAAALGGFSRQARPRGTVACSATPTPSPPSRNGSKVVCIGEALFDLISEQPGLPREQVQHWTPFAGGAPCNVATALAKLGSTQVVFVTALGRDDPGNKLFDIIQSSGVQVHAVQRRDEPTRDVYVTRDLKGDREFAGFGLPTDRYSDCFLEESRLPLKDIQDAAVLVTGTLGLAYPTTRAAMHKAVEVARASGCQVLVDVNWRSVFWEDHADAKAQIAGYLQRADLIKLSDADMEWLLGVSLVTALLNPCVVAEHFPNAKGFLVTAGEEGAAYCFPNRAANPTPSPQLSGYIPTFKVNAVDTTGAGDAFTAGFIHKLLQSTSLDSLSADVAAVKEAVVFAAACGALTTTRKGAIEAQPSLEESSRMMETSRSWYNFW